MENQEFATDLKGLDPFYQKEFRKIEASNETYKGKWNWWAFLFTGIWALYKQCWFPGIIILLTSSLLQIRLNNLTEHVYIGIGVAGIFWAIFMGWRGTWIYYNTKIKHKAFPSSL
jgi:hypothetical protein